MLSIIAICFILPNLRILFHCCQFHGDLPGFLGLSKSIHGEGQRGRLSKKAFAIQERQNRGNVQWMAEAACLQAISKG